MTNQVPHNLKAGAKIEFGANAITAAAERSAPQKYLSDSKWGEA
jgi:hypothetical protein